MNFAHNPERTNPSTIRCDADPFEAVLFHLISIESAAAARRKEAREAASRREAQLPLFDRQLPLF